MEMTFPLILVAAEPTFTKDGYVFDENARHVGVSDEDNGTRLMALFTNASHAERFAAFFGVKAHLIYLDDADAVRSLIVLSRRFQGLSAVVIDPPISMARAPRITFDELLSAMEHLP